MARASLHVSPELKETFLEAQDRKTRWIKLVIEGEHFRHVESYAPTVSVESDFNALAERVTADSACLFLFCKDLNATALRWTLIAYVPDVSPVREKMLYSSSREGLKRELGYNYFVGEVQATERSELAYAALEQSEKRSHADAPLTESERLVKENAHLECDTSVKSTAMGVVPFTIVDALRMKLDEFKAGSIQWIVMALNASDESVELVDSGTAHDATTVAASLSADNPSYVVFRHEEGSTYFVFSCPDTAPVRLKMMSSTAKATVLDATSSSGITFDNLSEIRQADDLVGCVLLKTSAAPSAEQQPLKAFAKPNAPGRRRRGRGRGSSGGPGVRISS